MTTPPGPTHARPSPCAGCSPRPRRQAAPGVVAHCLHRRKTSTLAGPPCASLELRPAPTLERHRGRPPPGPSVERGRWRRPFSTPARRSMSPSMRGGPATPSNNASRRRPAGPTNAAPRQEVQTVFHPRNFQHRSIASKVEFTTVIPRADPTVCCRVLHRIFLTLRLSCGASAPQRLRIRPPARRQLQPVVRRQIEHRHNWPGAADGFPAPRPPKNAATAANSNM